ncbi:hypothetical protein M413DRAFT_441025 [Hebeloma cylindrosporum]|uniref:Uncharacterized protein n=1 Tax=Hebeloma cylindrosporum TaxID=76867 RepID=A0A0C2Y7X6_HEBCY|nr:hypothetical protein M413DRAFT_441025 [Hebeloma cylindrosporum h7]
MDSIHSKHCAQRSTPTSESGMSAPRIAREGNLVRANTGVLDVCKSAWNFGPLGRTQENSC